MFRSSIPERRIFIDLYALSFFSGLQWVCVHCFLREKTFKCAAHIESVFLNKIYYDHIGEYFMK